MTKAGNILADWKVFMDIDSRLWKEVEKASAAVEPSGRIDTGDKLWWLFNLEGGFELDVYVMVAACNALWDLRSRHAEMLDGECVGLIASGSPVEPSVELVGLRIWAIRATGFGDCSIDLTDDHEEAKATRLRELEASAIGASLPAPAYMPTILATHQTGGAE